MNESWDTQMATLGALIRSRRKRPVPAVEAAVQAKNGSARSRRAP